MLIETARRCARGLRAVALAASVCAAGSAQAASFSVPVNGVTLAPGETFTFTQSLNGRFETWKYVYWLNPGIVSIHQKSFFNLHLAPGSTDLMIGVSTAPFEIKEFFTNTMTAPQTLAGQASVSGQAAMPMGPTQVAPGATEMIGADVDALHPDGFYRLSRTIENPGLVAAWWSVEVSSWWRFLTIDPALVFKDHHRFPNWPFIRGEEFVIENVGNDDVRFDFRFDAHMVPLPAPMLLLLSGLGVMVVAGKRRGRRAETTMAA